MPFVYSRGEFVAFYSQFLNLDGSPMIGVVNPQISVYHYNAITGLIDNDLVRVPMNLNTDNYYYYSWLIPIAAYYGDYHVVYYGMDSSGNALENSETFKVAPTGGVVFDIWENMIAVNLIGPTLNILAWGTKNNEIISTADQCNINIYSSAGNVLYTVGSTSPNPEGAFDMAITGFNAELGKNYLCEVRVRTLGNWITSNKSFSVVQ